MATDDGSHLYHRPLLPALLLQHLHAPLGRLGDLAHCPQLPGPLQGLPLMHLDLGRELALEGILVRGEP